MAKTSMNMEENIESLLTYALTWVTGIVFLVLEKDNKNVRFHAFQSIFTFLPLTILTYILTWIGTPKVTYTSAYGYPIPTYDDSLVFVSWIGWAVGVVVFLLWLFLMYKAYQGEKFKLPIVGDLAEKQAEA